MVRKAGSHQLVFIIEGVKDTVSVGFDRCIYFRYKTLERRLKMTTSDTTEKGPLWLSIEKNILKLDSQGLSEENFEASIQRIAGELDNSGYNVSRHGGNIRQLRYAMDGARKVGRPLMEDFNTAIAALTLDDVADLYSAVNKLINDLGNTWPELTLAERRPDVIRIVEKTRLDLLISKAKGMPDDEGIRFLIEEKIAPEVITNALDITEEKLKQVEAEMEKERAERKRIAKLLEAVEDKSNEEKVKHLLTNDVSEKSIIEIAKLDQDAINAAKQAMEAELKEKQRLEEEAAARKKEEAAGPKLEDIPPDEMLEYIESIREIMEFSDQEKEIRVMCDQSSIPKSLVDIAVSEPDRLDELEKEAEG
jgi:hypothetical protein